MDLSHCPVAIIDADAGGAAAVAAAITRAGFRVIDACSETEAAIILIAPGQSLTPARRPGVPVLIYGLGEGAEVPPYADDCLPLPDDPRFAACLSAWAPPTTATIERLAIVFGPKETASLLKRLHERLASMVKHGLPHTFACHQLAGFAGTLGFSELHLALQRLSEGEATASRVVLHQAQMTAKAIEGLPLFRPWH